MDDAGGVRRRETVGQGRGDRKELPRRQCTPRQNVAERFAAHQLHHEVGLARGRSKLVNGDDRGMVQRRGTAGLALESGEALRIVGYVVRKDLDRYFAAEPCVAGAIHFAHATGPHRTRCISYGPRVEPVESRIWLASILRPPLLLASRLRGFEEGRRVYEEAMF